MSTSDSRPRDVGILGMQVYFPVSYVSQAELETHDGVSAGKYTIGLGQDSLAFCADQEDVISMSLTVVQQLLEKYEVDPKLVGRLEVGSETVIDKSKSIKSALMPLFEAHGNGDIEGVDSTNACYGGTAALLNSLNWVESSGWDGRYAIVVAADSAVYAEGPARPTGGAGAVALLIGPNAPLVPERHYVSTHAAHAYDFYKPNLASEYPVVDGKLSQVCYLSALDECYRKFSEKYEKKEEAPFSLGLADFAVFHSPYNKLVQKSFARLLYKDFSRLGRVDGVDNVASLEPFKTLSLEASYTDRDLDKAAVALSRALYAEKVAPGAVVPKQVGNTYTASVYTSLASLVYQKQSQLVDKRILLFSYGSGLMSTLLSIKVNSGEGKFTLSKLVDSLPFDSLLQTRVKVSPKEFVETMELMETRYGACGYVPSASPEGLRPGTYHLTKVDDLYRRSYERKL